MESPPPESPEPNDEFSGLRCVGSYATATLAHEYALVILAMGHPCWIREIQSPLAFELFAEPDIGDAIQRELETYTREQEEMQSAAMLPDDPFPGAAGWEIWMIWAVLITVTHALQLHEPQLTESGASSNVGLFRDFEWWRPFTALFLHADWPHLLGNLLSGACWFTLVSRTTGPRTGWLLILSCGTLGNILAGWLVWPDLHRSIGASTAVFAALGLLSGQGCAALGFARRRLPWMQMTGPIIAGSILLGWLGSGTPGDQTDGIGHVAGFLVGTIAGMLHAAVARPKPPSTENASTR